MRGFFVLLVFLCMNLSSQTHTLTKSGIMDANKRPVLNSIESKTVKADEILSIKMRQIPYIDELIIAPNPVKSGDFLYFKLPIIPKEPVEVVVYDPVGNKVHNQNHLKPWKVVGISNNTYIVVIKFGENIIKKNIGVK